MNIEIMNMSKNLHEQHSCTLDLEVIKGSDWTGGGNNLHVPQENKLCFLLLFVVTTTWKNKIAFFLNHSFIRNITQTDHMEELRQSQACTMVMRTTSMFWNFDKVYDLWSQPLGSDRKSDVVNTSGQNKFPPQDGRTLP